MFNLLSLNSIIGLNSAQQLSEKFTVTKVISFFDSKRVNLLCNLYGAYVVSQFSVLHFTNLTFDCSFFISFCERQFTVYIENSNRVRTNLIYLLSFQF